MESAMKALEAGVSVFVEKPLAIRSGEARACVALAESKGLLVGVNFQTRYRRIRQRAQQLIADGFLGEMIRVTLQGTGWYRALAYYQSSPWRATWKGEGGGVLANQAGHDLDLLLTTAGMPEAVFAHIAAAGHPIEVEDEITAIMRWKNGAMGQLHITTREGAGQNFLEIAGTRGRIRIQGEELTLTKLDHDSKELGHSTKLGTTIPTIAEKTVDVIKEDADFLRLMHENFRDALRKGVPLTCTGQDGLRQVELANALLVSAMRQKWVQIPAADAEVDVIYDQLCATPSIEDVRALWR